MGLKTLTTKRDLTSSTVSFFSSSSSSSASSSTPAAPTHRGPFPRRASTPVLRAIGLPRRRMRVRDARGERTTFERTTEELGRGAFGTVTLALAHTKQWQPEAHGSQQQAPVALKTMAAGPLAPARERRAIRRERRLHAHVSGHAHVAALRASFRRGARVHLAVEYLPGGSVRDAMRVRAQARPCSELRAGVAAGGVRVVGSDGIHGSSSSDSSSTSSGGDACSSSCSNSSSCCSHGNSRGGAGAPTDRRGRDDAEGGRGVDTLRPLAPRAAVQVALQTARALAHMHEKGVAHRDIKPQNLMLAEAGMASRLFAPSPAPEAKPAPTSPSSAASECKISSTITGTDDRNTNTSNSNARNNDCREKETGAAADASKERDPEPERLLVKVIDLGMATSFRHNDAMTAISTERVGTAAYMAPEVHRGHPYRVTEADAYALGVTLHELLTGELPFGADSSRRGRGGITELQLAMEKERGIVLRGKVWRRVPRDIVQLVVDLTTPRRGQRPSATEIVERLEAALQQM